MTQTSTKPEPLITENDRAFAAQEGWDIYRLKEHENDYQIQKADNDDTFASDDEAWQFIIARAIAGSEFHRKIIALIKQLTPAEYDAYVKDAEVVDNSANSTKEPWLLKFDNGGFVGFGDEEALKQGLALYRESVSLDIAS